MAGFTLNPASDWKDASSADRSAYLLNTVTSVLWLLVMVLANFPIWVSIVGALAAVVFIDAGRVLLRGRAASVNVFAILSFVTIAIMGTWMSVGWGDNPSMVIVLQVVLIIAGLVEGVFLLSPGFRKQLSNEPIIPLLPTDDTGEAESATEAVSVSGSSRKRPSDHLRSNKKSNKKRAKKRSK